MLKPNRKFSPRTRLILILAVATGVFLGYRFAPGAWGWIRFHYQASKQQRALGQAKDFLAAHDPAAAAAAMQVALNAQPGNPGAWRTAADLIEQSGAREAISFRRRVVELEPENPDNHLDLANTALRFRDYTTAFDEFVNLPEAAKKSPAAARLALALSLTAGVAPAADALFAALGAEKPQDRHLAFGRAVLLLRHPQPAKVAEARAQLERLKTEEEFRLPVLRELYLDAIARREQERSLALARELAGAPGAVFSDKLAATNAELIVAHRTVDEVKPAIAALAIARAADAVQFAQWLVVQQRADDARSWIASLPPRLAESPEISALRAEWALRDKDWEALQQRLHAGAWGKMSTPALHFAIAARLLPSSENPILRGRIWAEAVRAATADLVSLRILQRLAASWEWPQESLQTFSAIAEQFPGQTWAHESRVGLLRQFKDARGMLNALKAWRQVDPLSERLRYNEALLEVLLAGATIPADSPAVIELQRLHQTRPGNESFQTGAAFALAKSGKVKDAIALVETLPASAREVAARAPYLAYVFAMAQDRARTLVNIANARTAELLPEESKLITFAETRIDSPAVGGAPKAKVPKSG